MFSSKKKSGELTIIAVPNLEDLVGVDKMKISYEQAVKRLDRMRENDRY